MRKRVVVTIDMSWLLFDIMNETFLRGQALLNRDNHKEVARMYASADERVREKISRSLKRGLSDVKVVLGEYLEHEDVEFNSALTEGGGDEALELLMPGNFNEAATESIGESVHDYLRNRVVADWYVVVNGGEAAQYESMARGSLERIVASASERVRKYRRL